MKTLGSIESTIRPEKSGVEVGDDGGNNSSHNDGSSRIDDFNKNSSDAFKSMCLLTILTLMLRTSLSTDSSTSATKIEVEYDGVDDGNGCDSGYDNNFNKNFNS